MKRIFLSTATVALVAFGAFLLIGRQECAAISNPLASALVADNQRGRNSESDFELSPEARRASAEFNMAQATDLFEPAAAGKSTNFSEPAPPSSKRIIKVPKTQTVYEDHVIEMAEVTPLQQQYSVLMLKRAQRMSEEELMKAIEEVEAELKEQDDTADAELQKAVEILNQLQKDSSGTPAARRAAEALPVLKGTETAPKSNDPSFYYGSGATSLQPTPAVNTLPTY